jgi:hypothetical protein
VQPPKILVIVLTGFALLATARSNPGPGRSAAPDNVGYAGPRSVNSPFPESVYGLNHTGSSFSFTPATGPFGRPDLSQGTFTYYSAPFFPRGSEGVFEMEVWLQLQEADGSWTAFLPEQYFAVNTPNPGPSEPHTFTWYRTVLPNQNYRVFGYVYIYNQGGSNQGRFPIFSTIGPINTGAANNAPRVSFPTDVADINSTQRIIGQPYTISADGEDDNFNLAEVRIYKNGEPFAFNPVSGESGNSANTTSDSTPGIVAFTAQAEDSFGALSPVAEWVVTILDRSDQNPVGSTNAAIKIGEPFTPSYAGGSGSGGWQFVVATQTNWDGSASNNTGTLLSNGSWSPTWTPTLPGRYPFFVTRNGDAFVKPSDLAGPYTVTVFGAPTVTWASTPPAQVTPGTALQWSAQATSPNVEPSVIRLHFDGSTDGGLTWTGNAYGYATSPFSNAFPAGSPGSTYIMRASVNDQTIGSDGFVSPIFSTVTVLANVQTVSLSPSNPTVTAGSDFVLTASGGENGYVWGGRASGSGAVQTLSFGTPGTFTVTAYSPAGGAFAQSNTAAATVIVVAASQLVSLSPVGPTITAGQTLNFTATGGQNGYIWGGTPGANGTSQNVTFSNPGTYTVSVYSPAGGSFGQSNLAESTVTVSPAPQSVLVTPLSASVSAGQSVAFTASGGQGGYVWGGSASGAGSTNVVNFPAAGSFSVSVYSPGTGIYAQSNTAVSSVTVASLPPTASLSASPTSGIAPLTTVLAWTTTDTSSVSVTGPGLSSNELSGAQSVTLSAAGSYTFTIVANGSAGSTTNSTTVVAAPNTATLATTASAVTFGSVFRDSLAGSPTTADRTLTFSNPGNSALTITAHSVSGAGAFAILSGLPLPYVLPAGGTAAISLRFGPGVAVGVNAGALTVTATTNVSTVALGGSGLAPKIGVTWK